MHFLSEDLFHIDTVLGQVEAHPQTSKQVFPLIHLVRQNLRLVTDRVRFLEEGICVETGNGRSGSGNGCGGVGSDCLHPVPFFSESFHTAKMVAYDKGTGVHHGKGVDHVLLQ